MINNTHSSTAGIIPAFHSLLSSLAFDPVAAVAQQREYEDNERRLNFWQEKAVKLMKTRDEQAERIARLEALVVHMDKHSAFSHCGFAEMSIGQKALFMVCTQVNRQADFGSHLD